MCRTITRLVWAIVLYLRHCVFCKLVGDNRFYLVYCDLIVGGHIFCLPALFTFIFNKSNQQSIFSAAIKVTKNKMKRLVKIKKYKTEFSYGNMHCDYSGKDGIWQYPSHITVI